MQLDADHRLCLAAAWFLAELAELQRSAVQILRVPELSHRSDASRPVDLMVEIERRMVSFEHTLIESYPEQIRDGYHLSEFTATVRSKLPGDLPPGTFTLVVATDAVLGLKGRAALRSAEEVANWVFRNAQELAGESDGEAHNQCSTDEPISAVLQYRSGARRRDLQFARWAPEGLQSRRRERLARAFEEKLPKLAATREEGFEPCLVLEDRDLSLANADLIADAARGALEEFDCPPDLILLVETLPEPALWLQLYGYGEWIDPDARRYAPVSVPESVVLDDDSNE